MSKLFDSSDSEADINLKTENEYAKKYDNWRQKEELHKLEQKYGSDPELSSSESDDSEPEVSEVFETDFLKTLSLLKNKDPRIYDKEYQFFKADEAYKKKDVTINEVSEDTKANKTETSETLKQKSSTKSLADVFADSDSDNCGDEILKVARGENDEGLKSNIIKEFLIGKVEHIGDDVEDDLKPLKSIWSNPELNENEQFLRDYILNKKYLDDDDGDASYSGKLLDNENLEEDERTVEEQGKFERAYNFRFEEPDPEYIKRYPRTMNAIRPKDDRRSRKRAEVRQRKEEEKKKKMEEIGRLKALKLKEIQEKIAKIKEVTGNEELAFDEQDIEGDFDPAEHDRRMRQLFDSEYYQEADDVKPEFPDLDNELDIEDWDNYEAGTSNNCAASNDDEPHCEDPNFNMDADYDPKKARTTLMEEIKETLGNSKRRRNRKRKTKLAQLLETKKPKFDPLNSENRTYSEFMNEYYKMDCEDIIGGDLMTRFKYREVVPNSFGLSVEEILLGDDKELNKWVSLKKAVKYRPEHIEKSEIKTYQLKSQDINLKKRIIPSLFKEDDDIDNESIQNSNADRKNKLTNNESVNKVNVEGNKNKKKRRRRNKKSNESSLSVNNNKVKVNESEMANNDSVKNKKQKKKQNNLNKMREEFNNKSLQTNESIEDVIQSNNDKKERKKDKSLKINNGEVNANDSLNGNETQTTNERKKKRKKKKRQSELKDGRIAVNDELKRKSPSNSEVPNKKKKFNKKMTGNSLVDAMSDARLKAYGLNPKKYRNFVKFKKY